jgi:type 1 glutamine amidotransferase/HEAT repeat protein
MNGKDKKMSTYLRNLSVVGVVLGAVCCVLLFANISLAVSAEEIQKIENAAPAKATAEPKQPRKLLVFNLCNGYKHESIPYWEKALEVMGRKTGAYVTISSTDMSAFKRENLAQFDAICLNNTTKLDFSDLQLREGLMEFVKGGKGLVGIHGATDNFYDWPEAAEMIGTQFSKHPWLSNGTWAVKIDDPDHPLTAAFAGKGFKINDEIYRQAPPIYSRAKQRVLLSLDMADEATRSVKDLEPHDNDTGISWIKTWGQGRVFYCSLGHNTHLTWNPAILRHYLDGIQFALGDLPADATPVPEKTLKDLLGEVAKYDFGQSRLPLSELAERIKQAHGSPAKLKEMEDRLARLLQSDATPAARQFVCRQLSIIGTDASVPTLAAMLTEKATSQIEPADMARYALERIPGEAADKALRDALDKTSGTVKVGIINSLGEREDRQAERELIALVDDSDVQVAEAAISALGKIGGKRAAVVLGQALAKSNDQLRSAAANAYLMCADGFLAAGQKKMALKIYQRVFEVDEPSSVRAAALKGMVSAEPKEAARLVLDGIKGDDEMIRAAAVVCLRATQDKKVVEEATKNLAKLSAPAQVQVISALADRGERSALKVVEAAAKGPPMTFGADVRLAALGALARLGDASSVALLAEAAAGDEPEQKVARESLYRLNHPDVDRKILAGIAQAKDQQVRVELIRAAAERNIIEAVELLLKTARDKQEDVRLESIKALKVVAGEQHIPALVGLVVHPANQKDRSEVENTLAAVALKISDASRRADKILAIYGSVDDFHGRCSLLRVFSKIGASKALAVLRNALTDSTSQVKVTAIRALSEWPGVEPLDDLRKLAKEGDSERDRVLALRGFVRLIGLKAKETPGQAVELYREAMALAPNSSEKRGVLAGVGGLNSLAALQFAGEYLEDAALQQEAEAAVVRIADSVVKGNPDQTKAILEKVLQQTKNDSLRERAKKILDEAK